MDKSKFTEVRLDAVEETESAPDILRAKRVMNNIADAIGMEHPAEPLEEVVYRVKKRRRINSFLTVAEIVLISLIILSSLALFLRGYIAGVTVNNNSALTETVAPPRSESVSYKNGALELHLIPGGLPLDYSTASAVRVSDGAEMAVECDAEGSAAYIPCPRATADYSLTICDTRGIPYTFTLHLVVGS